MIEIKAKLKLYLVVLVCASYVFVGCSNRLKAGLSVDNLNFQIDSSIQESVEIQGKPLIKSTPSPKGRSKAERVDGQ